MNTHAHTLYEMTARRVHFLIGIETYTVHLQLEREPWDIVVGTAAIHGRARGLFPGLGGLKETKIILSHPLVKLSIVGSLCDREVARSTSDLQGLNFESCVWRAVSSPSSHHPEEVHLA